MSAACRQAYTRRPSEQELRSLDAVSTLPAEYPGWMLDFWSQARVRQLADARA